MSASIREYFEGKSVLITGGTGFMGKVLLEKLLRSCPGIKKLYILCRYKKNLSPSVRVAQILKLPLFDKLRKENPAALTKVESVYGELTRDDDLGIKHEDYLSITENVNIIFNMAASLKLEATLKTALIHNTIGTLKILKMAKNVKHLEAFIHVSTTFCHPEGEIKETVLNITTDLNYVIDLAQWMEEDVLEKLRPKIIGEHPNCYTFTKALAEKLVEQYAEDFPVSIARPSIVIPAFREPLPGWVDSLNGPIGVLAAAGKGVLRSMLCDPDSVAQIIPVDIATNGLIIIAWKLGTKRETVKPLPVYNLSCDEHLPITWGEVLERGRRYGYEYPVNPGLWYPNGAITTNPFVHAITVFLLQIVPAYLVDMLLMCAGQKTFMVYVQKRIRQGMELLQYFTMRKWKVHVHKAAALIDEVQEDEKPIFYTSNVEYDIDEFIIQAMLGAKQYCLKEPLSTLPQARRRLKIYFAVDILTKILLSSLIVWAFYKLLRSYLVTV